MFHQAIKRVDAIKELVTWLNDPSTDQHERNHLEAPTYAAP